MDLIEDFGGYLGDEIVVAAALEGDGEPGSPLALAEVKESEAFRAATEARLRELVERHGGDSSERPVRFVSSAELAALSAEEDPAEGDTALCWMDGGLVAVALDADVLSVVAASVDRPTGVGFADTAFGSKVAGAYEEGVTWLFAVDLKALMQGAGDMSTEAAEPLLVVGESGLDEVDTLIVSQRPSGERSETRAVLSFDGPRSGMASWLGAPGPMGALDFVSADAYVAAAFVTRDPAAFIDEVLALFAAGEPRFEADISRPEAQEHLAVVQQVAESLGGEFAFAVDGPILPEPSWKVVFEVYDAERLQLSLEELLALLNSDGGSEHDRAFQLIPGELGNRPAFTLVRGEGRELLHYTVVDGYVIVAPAKALLERAIETAEIGRSITSSSEFRSLLPHDGRADMSAIVYQDLQSIVSPLLSGLSETSQTLTPEQRGVIDALGEEMSSSFAYAYAEDDRIIVASTSRTSPFGLDLGNLFSVGGILGLGGDWFGMSNR